jgi:hypothetical protein
MSQEVVVIIASAIEMRKAFINRSRVGWILQELSFQVPMGRMSLANLRAVSTITHEVHNGSMLFWWRARSR